MHSPPLQNPIGNVVKKFPMFFQILVIFSFWKWIYYKFFLIFHLCEIFQKLYIDS
jgi:hypothetical protein